MMPAALINFLLFQSGWLACVVSAANGVPFVGACVAGLIIMIHLWLARLPGKEAALLVIALVLGFAWDSLLVWQGLLVYSSGMLVPQLAPYWIVLMWALFATTLNVSLRWMKGRWFIAALFGAIGGPLAYYAGQKLGAVEFSETYTAMAWLMVGWLVFTPFLMHLSDRFDGYNPAGARI